FLPALGHPKRIASSNLGDSFLGSELTFGDLIQPEPDAYDVSVRAEPEQVAGGFCWVITALPKGRALERGTGVSREIRWLGVSDLLDRRVEQYDRRGELHKAIELTHWSSFGTPPHWLALDREVRNLHTGGRSTASFGDVRIEPVVPPDLFADHSLGDR